MTSRHVFRAVNGLDSKRRLRFLFMPSLRDLGERRETVPRTRVPGYSLPSLRDSTIESTRHLAKPVASLKFVVSLDSSGAGGPWAGIVGRFAAPHVGASCS